MRILANLTLTMVGGAALGYLFGTFGLFLACFWGMCCGYYLPFIKD